MPGSGEFGVGHSALRVTPAQGSAIECEIVTDFRRLAELSSDWQRLARSDSRADIFHQWGWAGAFWKAYGANLSLYAPVVRLDQLVIGILPLVRRGKVIEFLGAPVSDYNDLLCDERDASAVLEAALSALLQSSDGWRSCMLGNLPSHSRIVRHAGGLPSPLRTHLQLVFQQPAPTILLDEKGPDVLTELSNKDQLKRYHKKLQKLGRVTFRHLETRDEAREQLSAFFDQHQTRCAMTGVQSQFLDSETRAFFEALIGTLDPRTELRFAVLELDSLPIAYHFGFQINGKFTWYKPAFNIQYWDYCPGDVLLRSLFHYARAADVREFDFSVGDEPFKYRFANHVKRNYALHIERYPERLSSRLNSVVRRSLSIIRERPAAKRFSKSVVGNLSNVVSDVRRLGCSGLLRRCADAVTAAFRNTIWASDEALVLSCTAQSAGRDSSGAMAPVSLNLLAHLSLKYPEILDAKALRAYRLRLKEGAKGFIAYREDGETSVLWMSRGTEVPIPEIGPDFRFPLDAPALMILEELTTPHFRRGDVSEEVFRGLVKHCEGEEVWICCSRRHPALLHALRSAGFRSRHRIRYRALLHFFRRTCMTSVPETDSGEQETNEVPRVNV